jgi:DNA-directed RNA polymerase III subunit RPC1
MRLIKQVSVDFKKCFDCPFCGATNGVVKKVGVMRIIHEPYRAKSKEDELLQFRDSFRSAIDSYPEIRAHYHKAQDDLNPLKILELFKRIPAEDCELLGLDPVSGRPEQFIWTSVIVPPVCIRPSVAMDRGDAGRYV